MLVSPFTSPAEKTIAEWVLHETAGSLIMLVPEAIGAFYKPHGRYFDACAQGRLLQLSYLADFGHAVSLTRPLCMQMNALCATIAGEGCA